jgi:hypothetical protein
VRAGNVIINVFGSKEALLKLSRTRYTAIITAVVTKTAFTRRILARNLDSGP